MQLTTGTVRVQSGSPTVKYIYPLSLISVTGSFDPGDALTIDPGGDAIPMTVSSYDGGTKTLYAYRTGGSPVIAEQDTVQNDTQSGGGTIVGGTTPPDYTSWFSSHPGQKFFTVDGSAVLYTPQSGPPVDEFTLSDNYGEATENEAGYGIHADFTARKALPTIEVGDIGSPGLVTKAFGIIDKHLGLRGGLVTKASTQALSAATWTKVTFSAEQYDTEAAISGGIITVPAGATHAVVYGGVSVDTDDIQIEVRVNGSPPQGGGRAHSKGKAVTVTSAPIAVTDGDTLEVWAYSTPGATIDASARCFLAWEAKDFS